MTNKELKAFTDEQLKEELKAREKAAYDEAVAEGYKQYIKNAKQTLIEDGAQAELINKLPEKAVELMYKYANKLAYAQRAEIRAMEDYTKLFGALEVLPKRWIKKVLKAFTGDSCSCVADKLIANKCRHRG